jgi:hypothetical protein
MPAMATPPPPAPVWCEIGRPSPGEAQDWATWVSPLGDGGDALYRSLVLADGAIAVTVDLHSRGLSGTRTIHRGRCGLPRDPERTAERARLLLAAADRAAAKAVEARRGGEGAAAAGNGRPDGRPTPRRVPDGALRDGGERDGGASAERHERGDRIREHARPEAATAA